jgi:hypothetical protein
MAMRMRRGASAIVRPCLASSRMPLDYSSLDDDDDDDDGWLTMHHR